MSYDKYIKYKNKYLQLKTKYTQVGGVGMWTIKYDEGQPDTTPITQEESNRLNAIISQNMNTLITINPGGLTDENGKLLKNNKGEMKYKYIINADGKTGERISKSGSYKMNLIDITHPSSAYPPPPTASASAYPPPPIASVSYRPPTTPPPPTATTAPTASVSYRPPTTPPPPTASASAYPPPPTASYRLPTAPSTTILELKPNLPSFMSIYKPDEPPYTALVVEWYDLFFLDTNKEKVKDDVKFKKIDYTHVDMTFRGKTYSLENNGEPNIWIHKFN
jgi:hypothetical protein